MRSRHKAMAAIIGAALGLGLAGACGESTDSDVRRAAETEEAQNGQGAQGAGGQQGGQAALPETRQAYCAGEGPPLILTPNAQGETEATCTGNLAQTSFRYGLCLCDDYAAAGVLHTDGFDSNAAASGFNDLGGPVGINGGFTAAGWSHVGGSLWIHGEPSYHGAGELYVGHELHANGSVRGAVDLVVGDDAHFGGEVAVTSSDIGGDVYMPDASNTRRELQYDGRLIEQDVVVEAPCDCDSPHDIKAFVDANRDAHHNEDIGLDSHVLDGFAGSASVTLPCGMFFLERIRGAGDVTIDVEGRVALFVGEDIDLAGSLVAKLAPGAELDVFVAGDVHLAGELRLGDEHAPARARLYLGGERFGYAGSTTMAGNIYGPQATWNMAGDAEVFGSVFVKDLAYAGDVTIHYDSAILDAGAQCPDPDDPFDGAGGDGSSQDGSDGSSGGGDGAGSGDGSGGGSGSGGACSSCEDCGNQACNGGTCGACQSDSDCCSPTVCIEGQCVLYYQ